MDKKFQLTFADGTTVELTLAEILSETTTLYDVVKARQKVGNDKNGAEVYEGDKLIGNNYGKNYEYEAALWGVAQKRFGVMKFDFSEMELVK